MLKMHNIVIDENKVDKNFYKNIKKINFGGKIIFLEFLLN